MARAYPSHARALAAPAPLAPLIGCALVATGELAPLPRRREAAELLANLHGPGPHSHRRVQAARPRQAVWFEHRESTGSPVWRADEYEVELSCRLLHEYGVPANPAELSLPAPAGNPSVRAYAAGFIPEPRVPPVSSAGRYAAVARVKAAAGRAVLVKRSELPLPCDAGAAAGPPFDSAIAGSTGLAELAQVVAAAARVVCADGVAHLATALGAPSVVIFGPTSPGEWRRPAGRVQQRVLWSGRPGHPHAPLVDPGLLEVRAAGVIGELRRLPQRSPEAERDGVTA